MIREAIEKLVKNEDLTEEEANQTMKEIMEGIATPAQISSFITATRMKGETAEEITGCAKLMREKVSRIKTKHKIIVDTCGTGGDCKEGFSTFNISTASAFVAAGAGLAVAKHGNRSVSSRCGSADVLEELGVKIDISNKKVENCLNELGIAFLFAPLLHPAMKFALAPRKEIGIRTIFNILGPLTNPAGALSQVIGVYDGFIIDKMAKVLFNLGTKHALVVHGEDDGLDEISITGITRIAELKDGNIRSYILRPEDLGMKRAKLSDISGGDRKKNAQLLLEVLKGKKGARREVVLLNAAAAIIAGGLTADFKKAIAIAAVSIDSMKALNKLQQLIKTTNLKI